MTRAYAMTQLLKHGPLTLVEAWQITGWDRSEVLDTLVGLCVNGAAAAIPENAHSNIRYALL